MSIDAHAYNITVRRAEFEGETLFEARVKELPDLAEYGETFEEAYELAVDAIETTAEALAEQGRRMPPPVEPADDYSGRVTLRIPRSLHRSLAEAADAESVSLNGYMLSVLSHHAGEVAAARQPVTPGGLAVTGADHELQALPPSTEVTRKVMRAPTGDAPTGDAAIFATMAASPVPAANGFQANGFDSVFTRGGAGALAIFAALREKDGSCRELRIGEGANPTASSRIPETVKSTVERC